MIEKLIEFIKINMLSSNIKLTNSNLIMAIDPKSVKPEYFKYISFSMIIIIIILLGIYMFSNKN